MVKISNPGMEQVKPRMNLLCQQTLQFSDHVKFPSASFQLGKDEVDHNFQNGFTISNDTVFLLFLSI